MLMTGSNGFVGQKLRALLEFQGAEVEVLGREFYENPRCYVHGARACYSHIVHLAAFTKPGTFCRDNAGIQFLVNERINLEVLSLWQKYYDEAVFVGLGTSVSYPPECVRLVEDEYLAQNSDLNYLGYWSAKRSLFLGLKALHQQFGTEYVYGVPSMIYGPGYDIKKDHIHFIYDIIIKILKAKRSEKKAILWGDGYQRRELIHIDQFCKHLIELMQNPTNGVVNIGVGESYSIRELVKVICDILSISEDIVSYDHDAFVGAKNKVLDCTRLSQIDTTTETISLDDGLRSTIKYIEEKLSET